ncbi:carboxypeptidase-like regulatory domain-containing protein [Winogradskyella tangerina]|uniref:carboxypeptidase-like regulatory domain-containing protein n=1 Tax=Winogradskyella tangerina TaxID=2023240 RepID=UPI000DBE5D23|nr:carboxypeptidase-like regulatory domain-containing protein [Winogradskyella tangerina]
MKTIRFTRLDFVVYIFMLLGFSLTAQVNFTEYSGKVIDGQTKKVIESASLSIEGSNIGTISNSDGEFVLKVPANYSNSRLIISFLGYETKVVEISDLSVNNIKIELRAAATQLQPVNISAFKDAENLVRMVFKDKNKNVLKAPLYMTAFYRETIKRRNRNVSLTEAVVNILKQPLSSSKRDAILLNKARKSTDYKRLDTVSVKLQGGPFSTIHLDIMKYPEYIFTDVALNSYAFTFGPSTTINGRNVYVVNFKPKNNSLNLNYTGQLFIDPQALALVSADYSLDLSNKSRTRNLLVKKKPRSVVVYPLEANYKVDYKVKDGKWYYNYSSLYLRFKVKKKRQLFNKVYSLASEMAVTDWEPRTDDIDINLKNRLKPTIIIADKISGFSDPDFWGEFNVIEPDKSIESAIEKIRKSIEKQKRKESNP